MSEVLDAPVHAPSWREQPEVGLVGIAFATVVVVVLGLLVGPMNALQSFGALTTVVLPVMVMVGLWWRGWPCVPAAQRRLDGPGSRR